MLLTLSGVGHDYGEGLLFENISTAINKRDKIILIGKNGSGKSTLLKIIADLLKPTYGEVHRATELKIGYQIQERIENIEETLMEFYMREKKNIEPETEEFYSFDRRVRSILTGLEFSPQDWDRELRSFSGGEITRIALGRLLLIDYDLLLLDEPTNHLDLKSVDWLILFLNSYRGAVLLVSHDRHLIKNVGNRFWEINNRKLWDFPGSFEHYKAERELYVKSSLKKQEKLISEIERLQAVARRYRLWGEEKFIKQAKSKEKQIDRLKKELEGVSIPGEKEGSTRIRLPEPSRTGYIVLEVKNLSFSYSERPIFNQASLELHRGEKLGIVGPNGSGKSTFLKILTGGISSFSGTVKWGHNVTWGYLSQMSNELSPEKEVIHECWGLVRDWPDFEIRKYLGRFGFAGESVFKKVGALSGGEKTRLALAKMILKKPNVLIMDEPTNNLDIWSIQNLEEILVQFKGAIILVSHDREFLKNICKRYAVIRSGKLDPLNKLEDYLNNYNEFKANFVAQRNAVEKQQSFREKRRLSNQRKKISDLLENMKLQEKELEKALENLQGELHLYSTDYQKLQELQSKMETIEENLLNLIEKKELLQEELLLLEKKLMNLDRTIFPQSHI
ncbi:ABC transporter [Kosmotoga arenicorallina S304]|uniref:ABC transporter n=1 Tax=Kosmotoga arenicorallina S304 TaxID=1453497 RepID=A0A176K1D2_9BACT|nr:ABC-F family ATP-binding cassette domain-containing protein [Kosmotoga arenicorallina]OAA30709.1 ABC transporter [Kosmotoga arenicorallina S304]